jgi:hypothetical protein
MTVPLRSSRQQGLVLALALFATAWAYTPQTGEIVVTGPVTNGTPGGTVPADLPVTLSIFSGTRETGVYTTTLTADSGFRFDGLVLKEGEMVVVQTIYQGITYLSDFVTLEPVQQELSLPIVIYETTEDSAGVRITQLHIFLNRVEDRLRVGEYYLIGNASDQTWIGAPDPATNRRVTLAFTLPGGAENLWFSGPGLGERFLAREGGFADTYSIPPGERAVEVFFSYELPYRDGLRLTRAFGAPVGSVVLLVSEAGGVTLRGDGITPAEIVETQMGPALSYTGGPLEVGRPLVFDLVGQSAAVKSGGPLTEIVLGFVSLAAAMAIAFWLWCSPARPLFPERARPLVASIADLDADFERGRVEEAEYLQKREALKEQVRIAVKARDKDCREQSG